MKRYPHYKDSNVKWIGKVPEYWKRMRYKDILIPKDIRVGNDPSFTLLSLTKQGVIVRDISEGKGKFPKDFDTYKIVSPNDFVLCLFDVDETPRTVGIAYDNGMITGAYDIFSIHRANRQYVYYLYLSFDDKKCLKPLYKGLRKTIPLPRLLSSYIFLPPELEQRAIVAYLDRAVEKIDGYIAAKEAEIEKLGMLKQSVIAKAVTQGLNPDAPMKDSGIPWLGNVPEHWGTRKIKKLFIERVEKNHPNEEQLCATQSQGVIPQRLYNNRIVVVNKGFEGLKLVKVGDFVISLRSFQGGIEYAYYRGIISAAYTILKLNANELQKGYVKYLFKSHAFIQLLKTCVIGIREGQNINYDLLRKQIIPVPPADEQQDIVAYISRKTQEIDGFIAKIRMQIDKLKLYKQRLISDVVTGKICVCESFEEAK